MTVYVYQLLDRDGEVLYVGASADIGGRLRRHRERWGRRIARIEMKVHEDWETARVDERETILRRQPLHNIDGGLTERAGYGQLEGLVLTTLQQLGPLSAVECEKACVARGYGGHRSSVSACIRRLVDKGSVHQVGERPSLSGRYKTAAVYDAVLRVRKPPRQRKVKP